MKKHPEITAVLTTLVLSVALGFFSVEVLGEYGMFVFLFIPFLIGFLPPFMVGHYKPLSRSAAFKISFATLAASVLALLVFAMEGIICIAMATPILGLLTLLGSYIAYRVHKSRYANKPENYTVFLLLGAISTMGFDYVNDTPTLIPVRTTVEVNAPIEKVWNNVVTFNKIEEPTDWIFKTGISYPTDATIEGEGVGAIRHCNFTTGSFVEPITTWDEPSLLQFDVIEQPIPMNEWNPFWEIHPPHLDGYFQSKKGQFRLESLSANRTLLEGTTWYYVDIQPETYWKIWSDFIIHRIHNRVLNHIKKESETPLFK